MLVAFRLLDRQILDRDGRPVGKVDDVELGRTGAGAPYVTALLVGQRALGDRIGGVLGRGIAGIARRLAPAGHGPMRISYHLVADVDSAVHLSVSRRQLADAPLEAWLRTHLIDRIPGAGDAS